MPDLPHLKRLEAESIHILRESVAECERPVLLYSIGKDSSVLLHLARKAFAPGRLPFPLLHIATGWDFRDMIAHRDATVRAHGLDLKVHTNEAAVAAGVKPWTHGGAYADLMLTEALRQALDRHEFDAAFGGGRRDEERSRAKERVVSVRSGHRWEPRAQRPELWHLYNFRRGPGETLRVFPLSNWTEADVWQYILAENVPIVPLYLAKPRAVVRRGGQWIAVDDERLPLAPDERVETLSVRFRTLGCYPLTAAMESEAATVQAVIEEMRASRSSERAGRLVDRDGVAAMERKKREGYF